MKDIDRVIQILERHVSAIHVRSVLRHVLSEQRLTPAEFKLAHLRRIEQSLERGLRLFSSEVVISRAIQDLKAVLQERPAEAQPCSIEITVEADISRARNAARQLCEQLGAKGFSIQKVTTIVSELARNIVSYTPGGKIELHFSQDGHQQRMMIRAADRGKGIPNLPLIMSGEYRSRTGLGRGIVGTKRLADAFDISTGPDGTRIVAEVRL